jgi:beta-1,4-N-acetylglucosaminyltransferase
MLIAGSGGHTTELMRMMYDSPLRGSRTHRVWVLTEGDQRSEREIVRFEEWLSGQGTKGGTYEVRQIPRARKVHQPWRTVPFTVLRCLWHVYSTLTTAYSYPTKECRYPNAIITTGPGTGFIVCLGGWILRILGLIPQGRCHTVYIESIARVETLSLTGKLFRLTNIADHFIVQHEKVAKKYHLDAVPYLAARRRLRA